MKPAPQVLVCEWCERETAADDWNPIIQAVICADCLEQLMDSNMEAQP